MGVVYEGRQPMIGKRVAVKVLLPQLSNEHELVDRFLAEARAVNEIRHRGIVDIFSFGQLPEGSHYFVMEYLEGEGFDTIIKGRAPVPLGEAIGWTCEVLDALGAAHSAGIIHRDIKPSNLFLVNTGRGKPYVKLLDFGIAKLGAVAGEASPQTRASVIMGTPDYISPEQARGKPISPQTDLYAVGCVLFELVTGFRVFRGANTLQTMWSHVEDPPPLPSSILPAVPPELDELILWALEKDAANRPPSAEVFAERLEVVRANLGTGPLTPLPFSGEHGTGKTPPPSVRARVLASGTVQPTLKTPTARSGGQSALRTPPPKSSGGATRLSPLTVYPEAGQAPLAETRASAPLERRVEPMTSGEVDLPPVTAEAELPPPPKSRTGLVVVLLALLVIIGAAGVFVLSPSGETPKVSVEHTGDEPKATTKPPPVPVPSATPAPAEPSPVAVVASEPIKEVPDAGASKAPAVPVAPVEPTPNPVVTSPVGAGTAAVKKGVTNAQLEARLAKLEQKLELRETQTGEKDKVLRQIFEQARKEIGAASTDVQRREAWNTLNDIAAQFPK
jgi:serine/threonine-protein kinase